MVKGLQPPFAPDALLALIGGIEGIPLHFFSPPLHDADDYTLPLGALVTQCRVPVILAGYKVFGQLTRTLDGHLSVGKDVTSHRSHRREAGPFKKVAPT